jgi:hypothetical protein
MVLVLTMATMQIMIPDWSPSFLHVVVERGLISGVQS